MWYYFLVLFFFFFSKEIIIIKEDSLLVLAFIVVFFFIFKKIQFFGVNQYDSEINQIVNSINHIFFNEKNMINLRSFKIENVKLIKIIDYSTILIFFFFSIIKLKNFQSILYRDFLIKITEFNLFTVFLNTKFFFFFSRLYRKLYIIHE